MTQTVSRRTLLGTLAAGVAAVSVGTAEAQLISRPAPRRKGRLPNHPNSYYYKGGKFDEDAARSAVIELAEYHGYPVYPGLREKLWVSDYGLGKYTEVGLAAVGICNKLDGEFSYMLQDLFMLPNQMLPEHWHVKPDDPKKSGAQKDEGWVIRWGRSYVIGEGEANLPAAVKVPESHGEVTVNHCTVADPGVFVPLSSRGSHHWQFAGKEGVILTEVANYHDNASVRHQNKTANDHFLAGIK
jgi:D-lyxose ketol-isomerase